MIIVNCVKCGNPVMQFEEMKEFKINTRCGNCKTIQMVFCGKVFQIKVIQLDKLSTAQSTTQKVKLVI